MSCSAPFARSPCRSAGSRPSCTRCATRPGACPSERRRASRLGGGPARRPRESRRGCARWTRRDAGASRSRGSCSRSSSSSAVAVLAAAADLDAPVIAAVMVVAWLLVVVGEWVASRGAHRERALVYGSGSPPSSLPDDPTWFGPERACDDTALDAGSERPHGHACLQPSRSNSTLRGRPCSSRPQPSRSSSCSSCRCRGCCSRAASAGSPFIIAASFVFYGAWDWRFCFLLAFSIVWNHLLAVGDPSQRRTRGIGRCLLVTALVGNLGLLGYFKYYDFFVTSTHNLFALVGVDVPLETRSIVLPVGISFFTFMGIAYVVDVYRRDFVPGRPRHVRRVPLVLPAPRRRPDRPARRAHPAALDAARPALRRHLARVLPHRDRALHEGGDREPPRHAHRRRGLRRAEPALVARGARRDLRVRRPDLLRLLRLHEHRDRDRAPARLRVPAELRRAVLGDVDHGLLAPLAHDALALAPRLPLHPARRESRRARSSPTANLMLTMLIGGLWHGAGWTFVVWGGIHGTALVDGALVARTARVRRAPVDDRAPRAGTASSPSRSSASPGSSSARTRSPTPGIVIHRLFTAWGESSPLVTGGVLAAIAVGIGVAVPPAPAPARAHGPLLAAPDPRAGDASSRLGLLVIHAMGPEGVAPFIYFRF